MTTTKERKMTKTETRVLAGMRLAQRVHQDELSEHGQPFEDVLVTRTLAQPLSGILCATRICTLGSRAPSERQVHAALQRLVARGLVARDTVQGMGGGFTPYKLLGQ